MCLIPIPLPCLFKSRFLPADVFPAKTEGSISQDAQEKQITNKGKECTKEVHHFLYDLLHPLIAEETSGSIRIKDEGGIGWNPPSNRPVPNLAM